MKDNGAILYLCFEVPPWNQVQPYIYKMECILVFLDCDIALDEMGSRIDELESSINDLRTEMGVEGSPSPSTAPGPKPEDPKSPDGTA